MQSVRSLAHGLSWIAVSMHMEANIICLPTGPDVCSPCLHLSLGCISGKGRLAMKEGGA